MQRRILKTPLHYENNLTQTLLLALWIVLIPLSLITLIYTIIEHHRYVNDLVWLAIACGMLMAWQGLIWFIVCWSINTAESYLTSQKLLTRTLANLRQ